MKRYTFLIVLFCVTVSGFLLSCIPCCARESIRQPVVAGSFYPANRKMLDELMQRFLTAVREGTRTDNVCALVVPHAGYIYSGQVAAEAYAQVAGKSFDTVVVLAASHVVPFQGVSIYDGQGYETPFGVIPIDAEAVALLNEATSLVHYVPQAHTREHSLEVQLPFLQKILAPGFSLLPIVFGDTRSETVEAIAESLADLAAKKNILVIASTDLSHFLTYEEAVQKDTQTIAAITEKSPDALQEYFSTHQDAACGRAPVMTVRDFASRIGADKPAVLRYANSGDTAGDKNRVVGYTAIAITKEGGREMAETQDLQAEMSDESKAELCALVRSTILEYLSAKRVTKVTVTNPQLQKENGAFVTLHTNTGALRGCIGNFVSHKPLYETIQEMAIAAAFRDPRFRPVTRDEVDDLDIEISVLSPMEKVDDPAVIELGKHGIYIRKGLRSGTFLPQVATETGWSLEEFLGHCARDKAGLAWDGWKDADLYIYTAEVFGEQSHK